MLEANVKLGLLMLILELLAGVEPLKVGVATETAIADAAGGTMANAETTAAVASAARRLMDLGRPDCWLIGSFSSSDLVGMSGLSDDEQEKFTSPQNARFDNVRVGEHEPAVAVPLAAENETGPPNGGPGHC